MSNLIYQKDITVSTSAYAAGDSIGGLLSEKVSSIMANSSRVIHAITVADKDGQKAAMQILIFREEPDTSTITDNAAIAISDADLPKIIGCVNVEAADYIDIGSKAIACKEAIGLPIDSKQHEFYYAIQAVGTPTYTDTDKLSLTLSML